MMRSNEEGASTGGLTGWPLSQYRKRKLEIQFTGSGSEYFRIWITNLLLTVVTLGLYWPFAKARRLHYFYGNTLVDGQALSFHGDPWKMFRGHILLMVLMGCYSFAGQVSLMGGVVAFLVLCALWPALWRAGLQFRLYNTSWRGLRFGFEAPLKGAYLAFAPVYLPMIAVVMVSNLLKRPLDVSSQATLAVLGVSLGVALLLAVALSPWTLTLIKRYQHGGYRYAEQEGELALSGGSVYKLALKAAGLGLLAVAVVSVVIMVAVALSGARRGDASNPDAASWLLLLPLFTSLLIWLLMLAIIHPYFTARFQNLLWNRTSTQDLEFTSALTARSMVKLTLKNTLLTLLTLGLYRAWATVATARLRLQGVSVTLDGDLDTWLARQQTPETAATGDLAGDFFGIDMGL
ncbi:Uncharacterized membrane protein YjgN, DUF898 family [Roseateles sp. YR242]|uniref:YjgN family protein n=1 Tax=Roseateles sp. YR242 TaxID=1855305 RepID=UPI0008C703A0|nr:YjgN family protein [Roseateles sp. YR242]SEL30532.1 Uncharacterized membrane protein YjgN, DUF898 family [Roseateles sp. YR242]